MLATEVGYLDHDTKGKFEAQQRQIKPNMFTVSLFTHKFLGEPLFESFLYSPKMIIYNWFNILKIIGYKCLIRQCHIIINFKN